MTWWQWIVLFGVIFLSVPACWLVSRALDKLDIEIEPVNKEDKRDV